MKYSTLLLERRGAATIEDAERVLGGEGMLRLAREAGWIGAKIQSNRITLFDYDELLSCWKKICAEGYESLKEAAAEVRCLQQNSAIQKPFQSHHH